MGELPKATLNPAPASPEPASPKSQSATQKPEVWDIPAAEFQRTGEVYPQKVLTLYPTTNLAWLVTTLMPGGPEACSFLTPTHSYSSMHVRPRHAVPFACQECV